MDVPTLPDMRRALPDKADLKRDAMRKTAEALEAHFLAEMLKSAGLYKNSEIFGGGPGEEQFGSYLRRAQAEQIAAAGGVGLAESFYQAMVRYEGL